MKKIDWEKKLAKSIHVNNITERDRDLAFDYATDCIHNFYNLSNVKLDEKEFNIQRILFDYIIKTHGKHVHEMGVLFYTFIGANKPELAACVYCTLREWSKK